MCGIVGYYGNNTLKFSDESKLNLIGHRGPDHKSYFQGVNYFLGHTRLSIQDLSETANQPMFSENKSYVLIFNGEIYNHNELRKKLLLDIDFETTGDTETLLYGLINFGTDFINKINGILTHPTPYQE